MNVPAYLSGLLLLAVVAGSFWDGAGSLRSRLLGGWSGAPATLARIVLALSLAVATAEVLGVVGLLNVLPLLLASIGVALGLRRLSSAARTGPPLSAAPAGRSWLALALAAATLTAIHWAGPVIHSLDVGIYRQDSTWYHLPLSAWFAQTGSIGGLLLTDPLKLAVWYYPLNSELLHATGMVLLGNDLLSPLLNFGWMGVALLAAWCIGRPFRLAAATLLGAIVVVDSDMMMVQAGNAPSDVVGLACLLAAIAILLNGRQDAGAPHDRRIPADAGQLAVAALAAGLAIGAKVTMLVPVGVITAGILVAAGPVSRGRRAAIWLGGLLATGGFWYARNLVHAGNPLPWIQVGPLSGPSQANLYPRPAHSIAHYLADSHAWTSFFLPGLREILGPLWFVVLFASFAGILLGLRRRHPPLIRLLALAAAASLAAHLVNPVSASGPEGGPYGFVSNLRYAAPGIAVGLILLPLCESAAIARRLVAPAYAVLVAAGALASTEWIQPAPAAAILIGATAVLVPVAVIRGGLDGRAKALLLTAVLLVAVIAGYPQQRRYFDNRYVADLAPALDNPGFRATSQWSLIQTWAREQRGLRIGIVGTPAAYGQYALYGNDLANEVRYLGEPGPHGALTPIVSCRAWRERVDAEHVDAVVVTPEDPGSPLLPPQVAWTALGRDAQPIFAVPPAAVFVLTRPLDPSRCAEERSLGPYGLWVPGLRFPGTAARRRPPAASGGRPWR